MTRPDRRRLPPDRPVRNRFPNSGKEKDLERCGNGAMFDDIIRQREEIAEQIRALKGIQEMGCHLWF